MQTRLALACALCASLAHACTAASAGAPPAPKPAAAAKPAGSHADLLALFADWRAAQRPVLVDGVPDYTLPAMAAQREKLALLRQRLLAFDVKQWPVAQQVEWHVLRAEMNGLEFDHRALRPWAENPAFYVTVFDEKSDQPAREGPFAAGAVELWKHKLPLDAAAARSVAEGLSTIPALLAQAKTNLTGERHDCWVWGAKLLRAQEQLLSGLEKDAGPQGAAVVAAAVKAREATAALAAWVEEQSKSKTAPSGIGVDNYDWYAANVQLLPWGHREQTVLMERELARSKAALALEEQRNKALPPLVPVASAEEHARRFPAAVKRYVELLQKHEVMTVKPYFEPALLAEIGRYTPKRPLEFFTEVDYRAPMMMRTHGYHWLDLAMLEKEPHPSPIRRGALLYNVFDTRTEGLATAMEELMMNAGFFEGRERELIYVLVAQRAARALGELQLQANKLDLDGAAKFASANTPRGWLRQGGQTVWFEQHLYMTQPGYGTSYLTGKLLFDQLIAARREAEGEGFTLKRLFDDLNGAGLVPAPLVLWELGGVVPGFAR
jgi:hypothetical protein